MISCKEYATYRKEELKARIKELNMELGLAVIQIGNDSASNSYIKGKKNDCEEVGINFFHYHLDPDKRTETEVVDLIHFLNINNIIDGIIIQLPIPDKYDVEKLQNCISPEKDVDGFRKDSHFKPCTPKGIMDWLDYNDYDLEGRDVVVVGRSKIVGKPLVNMLIDRGATVTCCHSKSLTKEYYMNNADVVISAIGKSKYFYYDDVKEAEVVIDVGINRDENGKLCGDVYREDVNRRDPDIYVTPVPNGVGLLTRVALLENVVNAANRGLEK